MPCESMVPSTLKPGQHGAPGTHTQRGHWGGLTQEAHVCATTGHWERAGRSLGEGRPPTGAKTEPLPGVGWGWGTNHQASEWGGTCLPHRAAVHGQDGACLVSQLPLDDETATLSPAQAD